MRGVRSGEVQGREWDGGVRGVWGGHVHGCGASDLGIDVRELPGSHELWRGERVHHQLHLRWWVHGWVGRGGVHGVRSGDVQAGDGDRGVLGVSFGDQLVFGKHGCRGLQLHCRTHGRVGRCGVRGVRGGQVQVGDGGRGVLELPSGDQLIYWERRCV